MLRHEWTCVVARYHSENRIARMAVAALKSVEGRIIPIGHSMGAMVALEIWRKARERVDALALFDTDPGPDTVGRAARRDIQVRMALSGKFSAMVESQLLPAYFSPSHEHNEKFREEVMAMAKEQGVSAFVAQAEALANRADAWPLLAGIDAFTLVACGEDDRICPPRIHQQMAKRLPASSYECIANAGHFAPLEQPRATAELLKNWFGRLTVSSAASRARG